MKKTLCLTIIVLSFAGSAFAATQVKSSAGAQTIKGGTDATTAAAAPTPLIKFSTGVFGLVNFTANTTPANTSDGYLIAARHATGSKNFGTKNTATNMYWKQVSAGTDTAARLAADVGSEDQTGTTFDFAAGLGWTSY